MLVIPPERTVAASKDDFAVLTCSEILSFRPKIDRYFLWLAAEVLDCFYMNGCGRIPDVEGDVNPVET